ncbi:MAG TPA: N-acetyltransferase [Kofleriaceae bacterium]|nr:N-acetyltransferase [Kofleriaceae bacterium]
MIALRAATATDLDDILPRTRALNDHEGITIATPQLRAALEKLLGDRSLGGVWVIEDAAQPATTATTIGYAIVTFGFDLEFGGRDAWLTELWVDESARGRGAGTTALALLEPELRALDVKAYHLQVREQNPALRLYERAGFARVPRLILTRRL